MDPPGDRLDAIVIGGGPAGLSAALWLARYRCSTVVIDGGEYRNRWTEAIHGYAGLDPIAPRELLARTRAQVEAYPDVSFLQGRATSVSRAGDDRFVVDVSGSRIETRRLVLATGAADEFPEIDGFFTHYGASVFHCPSCDGYEARGRRVVAIGWSEDVVGFSIGLLEWAKDVTVVTGGKELRVGPEGRASLDRMGIPVVEDRAVRFVGERGSLEGIALEGGRTVPCDLAFFSTGHSPRAELAEELGCDRDDEGYVVVDEKGRTSVEGVYAAGDLIPGLQLVQVAAASGTVAGVGCALSLKDSG